MVRAGAGRVLHDFLLLPFLCQVPQPVCIIDDEPGLGFIRGVNQGLLSVFPDEVVEQEPSVLVSCSRFWLERQDSARTRGPLASPPVNSPSKNGPPNFAALRRCSSGWTSEKSEQEKLLFHQLESETGAN